MEWIRDVFLPGRTQTVLDQFKAIDLYPDVQAPSFSQHGGLIALDFELAMSVPQGTVYYTHDDSDPRPMGGDRAPGTLVYNGNPIAISTNTLVRDRTLAGNEWSDLNEATFVADTSLRVTEINYNLADPSPEELALVSGLMNDDFEFVEIQNIGPSEFNLVVTRFTDEIDFTFPPRNLDPGHRVVIVSNLAVFQARYGTQIEVAGEFTSGRLSNRGARLTLADAASGTILDFAFDDNDPRPVRAEGAGARQKRTLGEGRAPTE